MNWYTKTQFLLFRIIFGLYLTCHFVSYVPYCLEMFSRKGMIPDVTLLPTYLLGYSPIFHWDSPVQIQFFNLSLIFASVVFTFGYFRRVVSCWLFVGWILYLNRNPFITNPSVGYVGWLLLACVLIPVVPNHQDTLIVLWNQWKSTKDKEQTKFNQNNPKEENEEEEEEKNDIPPRRPASAFMLFNHKYRPTLIAENAKMTFSEKSKRTADAW